MMRALVALALGLCGVTASVAASEDEMVAKFCAGMAIEVRLPDRTRADCISDTHAIEVDFTNKWAEAVGQTLHYALWARELPAIGPRQPGVILVCDAARDLCVDHAVRLYRVLDGFQLPVTVWDCDAADASLRDCVRLDR